MCACLAEAEAVTCEGGDPRQLVRHAGGAPLSDQHQGEDAREGG